MLALEILQAVEVLVRIGTARRLMNLSALLLAVVVLCGALAPLSQAQAAAGTTLFYLEGTTKKYKDTTPATTDVLTGTA